MDILLTAAAVLAVSGPLLFTDSGFATDFTNSLWLAWVAGKTLVQAGHPSLFLNSVQGVFYPLYAFYGGSLFMAAGAVSELLAGHAVIAFVAITAIASASVYGGMIWLGRELGLRGLAAHAPALAVLTSAYYITTLYGRGDWNEFMVTSAFAPLAAGGLHLARAKAWRPLPVAIFASSAALFTAGHNITLLWGSTIAAATLLALWVALGLPSNLPYRRLAMLAGLGLAGASINAWFLLPDIAYAAKVVIAHATSPTSIWNESSEFNLPGVLLNPLRAVPRGSVKPALYVQAPDWFMAWSFVAAALLLRRSSTSAVLRRAWIAALLLLLALLAIMMSKPFWGFVGYPFIDIQFPYRLSTYVDYAVAALVLIGALALQRAAASGSSRRGVGGMWIALVAASAVSLGLCLWQQWVPNTVEAHSYSHRAGALASSYVEPGSWYAWADYDEFQGALVAVPRKRVLLIAPSAIRGDRFAAWMSVPPGPRPILTDITGGPDLVHLSGLRFVGRSSQGYAVVKRADGGTGPVYVVIETAHSPPVEVGRALSLLGFAAVLAVLVYTAARSRAGAHRRAAVPSGAAT